MNGVEHESLYPILLSRAAPEVVERLLIDYGVPVVRAERRATVDSNSRPLGAVPATVLLGLSDRREIDFADRFRIRHVMSWQELMPAGAEIGSIDDEAARSGVRTWREVGVEFRESIVRTPIAEEFVDRLKSRVLDLGVPWIRVAPRPAGYDGVFNFRFDLDEPDQDDWLRVVRLVDDCGFESGVSWFVCTGAARRVPAAMAALAGRDVQSHGHWHHVHAGDSALNASNLAIADRFLRNSEFAPTGFAAPGGRIFPELARQADRLGYRYLAGLGDVSGSPVRTTAQGIRLVHALPVCEGGFLEAGVDCDDTVVAGYLAAAGRAVSRDLPLFWFGHPDRRLGRKPAILQRLFEAVPRIGKLWHVSLSEFCGWIGVRNSMVLTVDIDRSAPGCLALGWSSENAVRPVPEIWIEQGQRRWKYSCDAGSGHVRVRLNADESSPIPRADPEPPTWPVHRNTGWRSNLREALDWERESPAEMLRGGPPARRVKGVLRRLTDRSWAARHEPLAWPRPSTPEELAA